MRVIYQMVKRPISSGDGWEWCWAEIWMYGFQAVAIRYY